MENISTLIDSKGRQQPAHKATATTRNDTWRADLRAHLAESVGQELVAGELFDQFGSNMPLHDATRPWMKRHKTLGETSHSVMRFFAFAQTLRTLNDFDPPLTRDTRITIGPAAGRPDVAGYRPEAGTPARQTHVEDPAAPRVQYVSGPELPPTKTTTIVPDYVEPGPMRETIAAPFYRVSEEVVEKRRFEAAARKASWGLREFEDVVNADPIGAIVAAWDDNERRQHREAAVRLIEALDAPANVVPLFPDK